MPEKAKGKQVFNFKVRYPTVTFEVCSSIISHKKELVILQEMFFKEKVLASLKL